MSYHKDLDEYFEAELEAEIQRRKEARTLCLCDYCRRPQFIEPACKFPRRHRGVIEAPVDDLAEKMRADFYHEKKSGNSTN